MIRGARPGLALVFFFSSIANLLRFVYPIYMLQIFDRVITSRSVETLVMLTALAILAFSTGIAIDVVRRRMLARFGYWIDLHLAPVLVQGSLIHSSSNDENDSGKLLRDLRIVSTFISRWAVTYLDVIFAPLFLIMIALLHPLLGVVAALATGAGVWLQWRKGRLAREPTESAREGAEATRKILSAAEQHRESVLGLAMGQSLLDRWKAASDQKVHERDRTEALYATFSGLSRGLGRLLRISIIAVGAWLFLEHSLTLGGLFAARIMSMSAFRSVGTAARNWDRLTDARTSYRALSRIPMQRPSVASYLDENVAAPLRVDALTFRYRGVRSEIFRRLDASVAPGELLLVIGAAETGKTTLARLLVGLLRPRHGQVRLGDIDFGRLPIELRSKLLGYLPQHPEIFDGTIRDNIARFSDCSFEAVVEAAKLAGVHDFIIRERDGYETAMSAQPLGMSGSQRKRIAMARAFLGAPRIIVLDEPMANLDSISRRTIEGALVDLKKRGSSIIVTQSMAGSRLVRFADQILDLNAARPQCLDVESGGKAGPVRVAELRRAR